MRNGKPGIEEIKTLLLECERVYEPVHSLFEEDDRFYELDFKQYLDLPKEYKSQGIVLPTGRDDVDTALSHTDLFNARIHVVKQGDSEKAREAAELEKKFYQGLIYSTNVNSDISPWIVGGKHFWIYGLCCFRDTWDVDMWMDKPIQKSSESDTQYNERLQEWRTETYNSPLPEKIEAVNPHCAMPDPSYGGRLYVYEKHPKMVFDTQKMYPKWSNPKNRKITEEAEYVMYWDSQYRCDLVDGEPVLPVKGGIARHKYGFIPYVFIDSGLGNHSYDGSLTKRYVGILRYIYDLLISESRSYSLSEIVLSKTALPWGWLEGANAAQVTEIQQKFGTYTPLPEGVSLHDAIPQTPPKEMYQHLYQTSNYIPTHAAPRSLQGQGEEGVRSGADRRLVIAEAASKYNYATQAFAFGTARVLTNCAKILKNVISENVRVWANTPTGDMDVIIDPKKLIEPFNCAVEFAPISEEDEYRRHDDWERLAAAGIVTRKWIRKKMSDVDAEAMEAEEEMEKMRADPMLNQMVSQYASAKLSQVLSVKAAADNVQSMPPTTQSITGQPQQQMQAGRRLVPPIPNNAPLGSAGDLQNQLAGMRSQTSMSPTQGQGGGGNRQ